MRTFLAPAALVMLSPALAHAGLMGYEISAQLDDISATPPVINAGAITANLLVNTDTNSFTEMSLVIDGKSLVNANGVIEIGSTDWYFNEDLYQWEASGNPFWTFFDEETDTTFELIWASTELAGTASDNLLENFEGLLEYTWLLTKKTADGFTDYGISNVSIGSYSVAVPEPSSLALFGLSLAALGGFRSAAARRRS